MCDTCSVPWPIHTLLHHTDHQAINTYLPKQFPESKMPLCRHFKLAQQMEGRLHRILAVTQLCLQLTEQLCHLFTEERWKWSRTIVKQQCRFVVVITIIVLPPIIEFTCVPNCFIQLKRNFYGTIALQIQYTQDWTPYLWKRSATAADFTKVVPIPNPNPNPKMPSKFNGGWDKRELTSSVK